MFNRFLSFCALAFVLMSTPAQGAKPPACHGSPAVELSRVHRQPSYRFERKTYNAFPLDQVAAYVERCHTSDQLTVISSGEVPFPVVLEAANLSDRLHLSSARIFLKTRGRYKELMVDSPTPLPSPSVSPTVAAR